jgi:hypothetical protein
VKYPYTSEKGSPSALIVPIRILPVSQPGKLEVDGKIDTGSAVSLIPDTVRKHLGLLPHGEVNLIGAFDDKSKPYPTYWIEVEIDQYSFELEVASAPRKQFLIGRDLLNQLILHLEGPKQFFEIMS